MSVSRQPTGVHTIVLTPKPNYHGDAYAQFIIRSEDCYLWVTASGTIRPVQ